jgi:hypothetical protein
MGLREIITGSDAEDKKLSASVGLRPYKRWYFFGWKSPQILYRRLRNKYYPLKRLRWASQRARRGYDDPAIWNLNSTLAELTVIGCRKHREYGNGYPAEFTEEYGSGGGWEKWEDILRRIEEGFQAWLDEDGFFHEKPEQEAKFKDGMALYGEWFGSLWD